MSKNAFLVMAMDRPLYWLAAQAADPSPWMSRVQKLLIQIALRRKLGR